MTSYIDALFLIGRVAFGGFFLIAAAQHFTQAKDLTAYARAKGVPAAPLAVFVTGLLLLVGSLLVILGIYPLVGLGAIALFLVGVTVQMHAFWAVEDAAARATELAAFQKNTALLGAALALASVATPWAYALPV